MSAQAEQPKPRMGDRVRDKDGDVWRFGRTRWSCEAPVDGVRVTRVGRLPTSALESMYGPLAPVTAEQHPRPLQEVLDEHCAQVRAARQETGR